MMHRIVSLAFVVALSLSSARADLDAGLAAYDSQDYTLALSELRPLAEQGNADAQYVLCQIYLWGLGLSKDLNEANYWCRKAAVQDHAEAQSQLGQMHVTGVGAPQSLQDGEMWTRRAAEQGLPVAQYNLGFMYMNGLGVEKDNVLALMWLTIAVDSGLERKREYRDELAARMYPNRVATAEEMAADWISENK